MKGLRCHLGFLTLFFACTACTSIPSSFKLEDGKNFGLGVNFRIGQVHDYFAAIVDIDFRVRLNQNFDLGIEIYPIPSELYLKPYLVAATQLSPRERFAAFVGFPVEFASFLEQSTRDKSFPFPFDQLPPLYAGMNLNWLPSDTNNDYFQNVEYSTGFKYDSSLIVAKEFKGGGEVPEYYDENILSRFSGNAGVNVGFGDLWRVQSQLEVGFTGSTLLMTTIAVVH